MSLRRMAAAEGNNLAHCNDVRACHLSDARDLQAIESQIQFSQADIAMGPAALLSGNDGSVKEDVCSLSPRSGTFPPRSDPPSLTIAEDNLHVQTNPIFGAFGQDGAANGSLYSATACFARPDPAVSWLRFMKRIRSPERAISTASTKKVSLKAIMLASFTSFL